MRGGSRPTRGAQRRAPWIHCYRRVEPTSRGTRGRGRLPPSRPIRERRERDVPLRFAPLRSGAWEGAGASGEKRPMEGKESGLGEGRRQPETPRVLKPAFPRSSPSPPVGALQPPRRAVWRFPEGLWGSLSRITAGTAFRPRVEAPVTPSFPSDPAGPLPPESELCWILPGCPR